MTRSATRIFSYCRADLPAAKLAIGDTAARDLEGNGLQHVFDLKLTP